MIPGVDHETFLFLKNVCSNDSLPVSQKKYLEMTLCIEPLKQAFLVLVKQQLTKVSKFTDISGDTFFEHTGNVWICGTYKHKLVVCVIYNMDFHCATQIIFRNLQNDHTVYFSSLTEIPLRLRKSPLIFLKECIKTSNLHFGFAKCVAHCAQFSNTYISSIDKLIRSMRDDDDDDDAGDNSEEDEYFYVDCEPVVFHCDGWDMNIFGSNISTFINGTLEDVD